MPQPAKLACRQLMPGDASGLAFAGRPRSDDEIVAPGPDRLDQFGDGVRIVRAVAVHEHYDLGVLGRHGRGQASPAIAAAGVDDVGAGPCGPRHGGVTAAAIGDDHALHQWVRDAAHDIRDRLLLVERGDDDHDPGVHLQRLQRRPQLAQAAGGLSDKSASRNDR